MRMKTGGFTPCDRRPDRGKVAIAAAAALFLFAARAQAGVTDFVLDPLQSYMTYTYMQHTNEAGVPGANQATISQNPLLGGNLPGTDGTTAHWTGHMAVDVGGGGTSLKFVPGYSINAISTGNWYPGVDANGNTSLSGAAAPGEYGLRHGATGTFQRISDDKMTSAGGNPTLPVDGFGNFNLGTTQLVNTGGISRLIEGTGFFTGNLPFTSWNLKGGVTNFVSGSTVVPIAYGATTTPLGTIPGLTTGGGTGHFDPILNTITINFNVAVPFVYQPGTPVPGPLQPFFGPTIDNPIEQTLMAFLAAPGTGIPGFSTATNNVNLFGTDYMVSGQLVMIAVVPEPSSMILLGAGAVGLIGYAWRARKGRAVVA